MISGVIDRRLELDITGGVVALILVDMVGLFARSQKSTEFVFQDHDVQRVETFRIPTRMCGVCPAIPITASSADREDREHPR